MPTKVEMISGPTAKAWLHRIGSLLGIAGVIFVSVRLYQYQGQIGFEKLSARECIAVAGLIILYAAANFLLALAWRNLLCALNAPISLRAAVKIYATSQLAKYVPGNIFQFASRQAIGTAVGISGGTLLKSAFWELSQLTIAAAVFGVLLLPILPPFSSMPESATAGLFLLTVVAAIFITRQLWNAYAASAVACYLAFLAISGLAFSGALSVVRHGADASSIDLPTLVGVYVIAWLAGLLTPGAPAGIGVREAVLLFLLAGRFSDADILLAVVVGRAITVTGDLLFYVAGRVIPGRTESR